MREAKRSIVARAATFARFVGRQRGRLGTIAAELTPPDPAAPIRLDGSETGWTGSGYHVAAGDRFRIIATGHQWLARPIGLVIEPRSTLFMRIGGGPVRKLIADDAVYEAWADGEVMLLTKALSEFADQRGTLLPGKRRAHGPGIAVRVEGAAGAPDATGQPAGWTYLWRLGDGRIYTGDPEDIAVSTQGDVGILQREVDLPLTHSTTLSWDWLIERLPSDLPEDLALTHDYLSIAVEFENGRDLTYMWSAGLPEGHVFRCPLGWWCERETHWTLRSGKAGLGQWHCESRLIAADYAEALGGPLPERIVRVWLIANSIFQRGHGKGRFAHIRFG
jgi:hypothetical protein